MCQKLAVVVHNRCRHGQTITRRYHAGALIGQTAGDIHADVTARHVALIDQRLAFQRHLVLRRQAALLLQRTGFHMQAVVGGDGTAVGQRGGRDINIVRTQRRAVGQRTGLNRQRARCHQFPGQIGFFRRTDPQRVFTLRLRAVAGSELLRGQRRVAVGGEKTL